MADSDKTQKVRKNYRREFKLKVIKWFYDNERNVAGTAFQFEIDREMVRRWVDDEVKIRGSKEKSKKIKSGRTAAYPDAERALFAEFSKLRSEGRSAKRWWFNNRINKLVNEHYPEETNFKHSDCWFAGFCRRYRIAHRRKTHVTQILPTDKVTKLNQFHQYLNYIHRVGKYQLCDLANMDQTPLSFILDDDNI